MLVIRFFRTGKRNQPFFKIVVTDKRNGPRGGRFVEQVGFWNPTTKEKKLNAERVKYWLSVGAKPSDTVYNILVSDKILEGKKMPVHKKSKKKEAVQTKAPEQKPTEEKPAETTAQSVSEEEPQKKEEAAVVETKPENPTSTEKTKKD